MDLFSALYFCIDAIPIVPNYESFALNVVVPRTSLLWFSIRKENRKGKKNMGISHLSYLLFHGVALSCAQICHERDYEPPQQAALH